MSDDFIALNRVTIDGVVFVYTHDHTELQCADCLFSQGVDVPDRDKDGLVCKYNIKQYHAKHCRWADKNQGEDFLGNPDDREKGVVKAQ